MMKIVFFGTPEFAAAPLAALAAAGYPVGYVVTQPDKARDRGKKLQYTPVKEKALELNIPVLQPEKIKGNTEFMETLAAYGPDLIVVAAYGKILPKALLELPAKGCVNIHASLLPRHRGAAPIQRAILDGDVYTGVTLMQMAEGLDTGDMLAARKTLVGSMTAGELHDVLAEIGASLLLELLPDIEAGRVTAVMQNEEEATYAPMIFKQDGHLDFTEAPEAAERRIRAMSPWPGAFAAIEAGTMKIWSAIPEETPNAAPPGTVSAVSAEGVCVACGGQTLKLQEIQMPGKKRMAVREYLKGNKIEIGTVLR